MARTNSKAARKNIEVIVAADTIDTELAQAIGICAAVGIAVACEKDFPEEGMRNALWGAQDLMRDAQKAAETLHRHAQAAVAPGPATLQVVGGAK